MAIKHAKVSAIPDGADTSVVRPSDWNAAHVGSGLTQGNPLGYDTAFYLHTGGAPVNGGTYRLTFRGQQTAPIGPTCGALQPALEALSNVGVGNVFVDCEGDLPNRLYVFFTGALGRQAIVPADFTISAQGLTQGGAPVTLNVGQWEYGYAPTTAVDVAQVAYDETGGTPMLLVNIGSIAVPNWKSVTGFAIQDPTKGVITALTNVTDTGWVVGFNTSGVARVVLTLSVTGDLTLDRYNTNGTSIYSRVLSNKAAYVNPATATAGQIATALINAGIMAAS